MGRQTTEKIEELRAAVGRTEMRGRISDDLFWKHLSTTNKQARLLYACSATDKHRPISEPVGK